VVSHEFKAGGYAALFVYPSQDRLVAGIGGTDIVGMRLTDRIPILAAGTAYPDWTILGPDVLEKGSKGIVGAGFFGPDWGLTDGDGAWQAP
jgi:hypothetical protein